jgi:hypothetical protein
MTSPQLPDRTGGTPLCVVTRLEFPRLPKSMAATLRFWRLRRVARRRIDGLVRTWVRWSLPSTVYFVSIWEDENSLLTFTTLEEHVEAVRWVIRARGRVWSGVFELTGTSSMSQGWIGSIERWKPRVWHEQEPTARS